MRSALAVIVAAMLLLAPQSGSAQQPRPTESAAPRDSGLEARTAAVASELRCPVCQGLSIQDSPSDLSQSMKGVVREQLAAGRTPDEVKAYFVSKYGEWILLAPKASGFNILAYAVPFLIVLGGGVVIAVAVRRWTSGAVNDPPSPM
ncbi:MAG: cytochrome c-type biogenesis protein [bacterium]